MIVATKAMKRIGLWVRLCGWEVALLIAAVQFAFWVIEPNDLEVWCERNAFGKIRRGSYGGYGASRPKFKTVNEREQGFVDVMRRVSQATVAGGF